MSSDFYHCFQNLPPKFLGNRVDELTNGIFRWRTIKNMRSKKRIPESCFIIVSPRKVLIIRDQFLNWAKLYAEKEACAMTKDME